MDGQNFENENNVTIDTTAAETVSEAEVTPAAEPVQETPVVEPVNNYQDYTANVQPQTIVEAPKAENKETNVLANCKPGTWYSLYRSRMLYRLDRSTVRSRRYHLCCICQQAG